WRSLNPLAIALDGKTLATAQERTVRLWDLTTGRQRAILRGHDGDKLCAAFSPDGKLLATGEGDHDRPGTVRLWDAVTSEQLASLTRQTGRVESVAFSPDGKLLAGTIGDEVKVWDVKTQRVRAMLQGRGPVAFSPDGKLLAVTARDTLSVILWDLEK